MSIETIAWAKERRTGDRTAKAILIEIANWAKPNGVCEFLSIARIAEVVEVDPRTVKRHLARLERRTDEGGLGLLRRVKRERPDGGQSANGFELVGYLAPDSARGVTKCHPPRCQNVMGGGDAGVTPKMRQEYNPSQPNGCDPRPDLSNPISEGWVPPLVQTLPDTARALVEQWPAGAYEAVSETFRLHCIATAGMRRRQGDWRALHARWVTSDHGKVMRDAKAGISFAALAKPLGTGEPAAQLPAVAAQAEETFSSAAHRIAIREAIGEEAFKRFIGPAALFIEDDRARLVVASEFQRAWIEQSLSTQIIAALNGLPLRVEVERARRRAA